VNRMTRNRLPTLIKTTTQKAGVSKEDHWRDFLMRETGTANHLNQTSKQIWHFTCLFVFILL
jgi:hypothetical protein